MQCMPSVILKGDGAHCVGVHLEGPFLSYEKRGAQNAQYLQKPNMEELEKLNEACGGQVRMITVAPKKIGIWYFIRQAQQTLYGFPWGTLWQTMRWQQAAF